MLLSGTAVGASYQRTDGTIADPILTNAGSPHPYSGGNLEPGSQIGEWANLSNADLSDADLSGADLSGANLFNVNLDGADLTGANLTNVLGLITSIGDAFYDINTDFSGTTFDPVAAGWTFVPEPNTALLMSLGLAGLAATRR